MHFQLNSSTIRSLNNSIFERQTLRSQPEVEIHFNKFGWGLYAGSGGGAATYIYQKLFEAGCVGTLHYVN